MVVVVVVVRLTFTMLLHVMTLAIIFSFAAVKIISNHFAIVTSSGIDCLNMSTLCLNAAIRQTLLMSL